MNRTDTGLRTRARAITAGLTACAALGATALTGCSSGQIAQTSSQAAGVNGTEGVLGHVALRNVRIQADQSGDHLRPGRSVDLLFVASNQSPEVADELTEISTPIGEVSLGGSKHLPAGGILVVATPAGQKASPIGGIRELRNVEDANAAAATVKLDEPISNGLTYDFTFTFKKAGDITLMVPIAAATAEPAQER